MLARLEHRRKADQEKQGALLKKAFNRKLEVSTFRLDERRERALERLRQGLDHVTSHKDSIKDEMVTEEVEGRSNTALSEDTAKGRIFPEMVEKKSKNRRLSAKKKISPMLMVYDHLISVGDSVLDPDDEIQWIMKIRPDGRRALFIVNIGFTYILSRSGCILWRVCRHKIRATNHACKLLPVGSVLDGIWSRIGEHLKLWNNPISSPRS